MSRHISSTSAGKRPPDAWDRPSLRFLPAAARPAVTMFPDLLRDPLSFLVKTARDYGDIACVSVRPRMYLLSHPEYVKHVLQDNHQNYCKGRQYAFLKVVLGTGLLAADGEEWRRHRRLVQPAFNREHHRLLAAAIDDAVSLTLAEWDKQADRGDAINVRDSMIALTLDILMRSLFSTNLGHHAEALHAAFLEADSHIDLAASLSPVHIPKWVPTPRNRRFQRAMHKLDGFIYATIHARRLAAHPPGDLLTLLLHARDEESGAALTDQELRDEVIAVMHGGYEPLSDVLTWTWYSLWQHPTIAKQVDAELSSVLGGRPPRFDDVPKLRYTAMLLQEVLRLYPPGWAIGRTAIADDCVGGFDVPAGAFIVLSPYVIQRDARWWDEPEAFDPTRFSPERSQTRHRLAYFPFAAGPRMCVARDFAMIEGQLIVAAILQRFRLEGAAGPPIRPVARYGLEPSTPLMMRIKRRQVAVPPHPRPPRKGIIGATSTY